MTLRTSAGKETSSGRPGRPGSALLGGLPGLAVLLLLVFGAGPASLRFGEMAWLLEDRGPLPALASSLLALGPVTVALRLLLLALAMSGLLLAVRAVRGRLAPVPVALLLVSFALVPQMALRLSFLGPWAVGLLVTGAALALGSRRGRGRVALLLGLAAAAAWLEPALALAPLAVALALLLPGRHDPLPALLAVAASGFLWAGLGSSDGLAAAPLPGAILCLALAVVLALPSSRMATLAAVLLLAASLVSWKVVPWTRAGGPPVIESLRAAGMTETGAGELLAGPGVSRGVTAYVARGLRMEPVERPRAETVGLLELASARSSEAERRALEAALGERVLERSLLAGEGDLLLRLNVYRSFSLTITEGGARPNIAIVSVDTLRADRLPFYGYERDTAPSLARWSEEALVYERAFSTASKTAPSFASLMTGRLPVSHGLRSNYDILDPGNWTLARVLRRAGYHTAAFVSSFVLTRDNCGLDLGFEVYDQTLNRVELHRENRPIRLAPELAEAVETWTASRREQSEPWFLWIHAIDPHGPYTPLPEFEGSFRSPEVRLLDRKSIPNTQWLGTEDFNVYRDAYDAEILQTDRSLGQLVEALRALPSPEGLIVIFVADHGESFGEREVFFQHGNSLHHELTRVPLVVQDSAAPAAGREPRPVSLMDLMPSLLERLGIETDLPLEGLPLHRRVGEEEAVLGGWLPNKAMALRLPWKLHLRRSPEGKERVEVYDLLADPEENRPLPPDADLHGKLLAAARGILDRDPLNAGLEEALRKGRWEGLTPEEMDKLRALGYAGP